MQHWIDECMEHEDCKTSSCGDYQKLNQSDGYTGKSWYFDAGGQMVAYRRSWEGDGGGCQGDKDADDYGFSGYLQYGEIPAGC